VSQPFESLRIPLEQLGKHPSAGQASFTGHARISHPQPPPEEAAQTGPPNEPSEQTTFGAPGTGPLQSVGVHPPPPLDTAFDPSSEPSRAELEPSVTLEEATSLPLQPLDPGNRHDTPRIAKKALIGSVTQELPALSIMTGSSTMFMPR